MTNRRQGEIGKALSALLTGSKDTSRAMMITQAARLIFSAYPKDEFADPDTFVFQLGIVLERYPDDVIVQLSDPLIGIQRKRKKAPSLAYIVEACEELMERRKKEVEAKQIEPPVDPVMQARVGRLFDELLAGLRAKQADQREEDVARFHAELHGPRS